MPLAPSPARGASAATFAAMCSRRRRVIAFARPLAQRRESLVSMDVLRVLSARNSGEYLGQFDEVAEWIRDERQTTTDDRQFEGLGHDRDAATAELRDSGIHVTHIQAEVVVAGQPQAVAQVRIDRLRNRLRFAVAEQLDVEVVVG